MILNVFAWAGGLPQDLLFSFIFSQLSSAQAHSATAPPSVIPKVKYYAKREIRYKFERTNEPLRIKMFTFIVENHLISIK